MKTWILSDDIVIQKIKAKLTEGMLSRLNSSNWYLQYAQDSLIYGTDKHEEHCIMLGKYFCNMMALFYHA